MKARIGRHKVDRIEALPKDVREIGWKAQVRLCARYRRLSAARPLTSSMSLSHAKWWASSGRLPAQFNPRQRRRDHDLTNSQQRRLQTQIILGVVCGAGGRTMPGSPRVYYELLTLATLSILVTQRRCEPQAASFDRRSRAGSAR